MLFFTLAAGLLFGLYFGLVGIGLTLIAGVVRIVNIAHGDFIVLGGYVAFWLFAAAGVNPLLSALVAFAGLAALGLPLYRLVVPRLMAARDPEMLSIILFFGLSQVLQALMALAFGTNERSVPSDALGEGSYEVLGESLPASWVVGGLTSAVALAAAYLYLYRTRLGAMTRAVMVDRSEALVTGIDVDRVASLAFALGLGLAGVAGVFAPFMFGSITPSQGTDVTLTAFAVVVVGALGNPAGALLGGLVFGVSYMMMQSYLSTWAGLLPYLVLIGILLVRPSGLLGRAARHV